MWRHKVYRARPLRRLPQQEYREVPAIANQSRSNNSHHLRTATCAACPVPVFCYRCRVCAMNGFTAPPSPSACSIPAPFAVRCDTCAAPVYCCMDFNSCDHAVASPAGMSFSPGREMSFLSKSLTCKTLSGLSQGNLAVSVNRCSPLTGTLARVLRTAPSCCAR